MVEIKKLSLDCRNDSSSHDYGVLADACAVSDCKASAGDTEVLEFISQFYNKFTGDEDSLRMQFRAGYCWHFAHMLKATFDRGEVCWAAPFGHFVWCDTDGTPYDVEGLYCGEASCFVPESYMGNALLDFKHIPGKGFNASISDLESILNRYLFPKRASLVKDEYGCLTVMID